MREYSINILNKQTIFHIKNIVIMDIKLLLKIYNYRFILPIMCLFFWVMTKYSIITGAIFVESLLAIILSNVFECMYSRDANEYQNYSIAQTDLKILIIAKNISTTILFIIYSLFINTVVMIADEMNSEFFRNATVFAVIISLYSLVAGNIISSRRERLKNRAHSIISQFIYVIYLSIVIIILKILSKNVGMLTSIIICLAILSATYMLSFKITINTLEMSNDGLLEEK